METFFWEQTLPTLFLAEGLIVCGFFVVRHFVSEIQDILEEYEKGEKK